MFDQSAVHSALTRLAINLVENEAEPDMEVLEAIVYTFVAEINQIEEDLTTDNDDRYVFTTRYSQRHWTEMFSQLCDQVMPDLHRELANVATMISEHEVLVFSANRVTYAQRRLEYEGVVAALKIVFQP